MRILISLILLLFPLRTISQNHWTTMTLYDMDGDRLVYNFQGTYDGGMCTGQLIMGTDIQIRLMADGEHPVHGTMAVIYIEDKGMVRELRWGNLINNNGLVKLNSLLYGNLVRNLEEQCAFTVEVREGYRLKCTYHFSVDFSSMPK